VCKYCSHFGIENNQFFPYGYRKIIFLLNPNPSITVIERYKDDTDEITMEIDYCPFCGRKLESN